MTMKENRIRNNDRRQELASSGSTLTIFDCKGGCRKCERRITPDRRLNNISVEEVDSIDYIEVVADSGKE
jgi:hypothetical protein